MQTLLPGPNPQTCWRITIDGLTAKPEMNDMSATAIPDENVFDATAVIVYSSREFATDAKALLERVAHQTNQPTNWAFKPWRVDMLQLPPAAETALAEAAEAHLLVLAMIQPESFFPGLMDWLEQWARCRQVQEAALAVWSGGNAHAPLAPAAPGWSQFAEGYGLSLIKGLGFTAMDGAR
jgi:hypothetical protein